MGAFIDGSAATFNGADEMIEVSISTIGFAVASLVITFAVWALVVLFFMLAMFGSDDAFSKGTTTATVLVVVSWAIYGAVASGLIKLVE